MTMRTTVQCVLYSDKEYIHDLGDEYQATVFVSRLLVS
jgi:hypothetical protein